MNTGSSLHGQLRGRTCQPFAQDMRVKVRATGLYTYPDVLVACGAEFEGDTLLNPSVVIEVLSPTTEAYDRGDKFAHYRRLVSLTDYVLIAQDRMRIEHFQRQPDGNWLLRVAEAADEAIELTSINCRLDVSEVYERVVFDAAPAAAPAPPLREAADA
jgi:Uma2 family endonuclease